MLATERSARIISVDLDGMQVYSLDIGHGGRPTLAELERYFRTVLEAISTLELPGWHMRDPQLPLDDAEQGRVAQLLAAQGITDGSH